MNIGIPKETRPVEFRVGLSPAGVEILCQHGHTVYVQHEAGIGAGFSDQEFEKAGARLAYSAEEVFGRADLLLKVARPLRNELEWLKPGSILMGLLHLVAAALLEADREALGLERYEYLLHVLFQRSLELREKPAGFDGAAASPRKRR